MADSEDDKETGDESIAQLGTHGYNLGFPHNPTRTLPGISPAREASDFLPTSELRLPGKIEGFSPYGPANDSVRNQNIFGMTNSTRGVITAKSFLDLLAQHVSKNETREGIIMTYIKRRPISLTMLIGDF
jgi:hypothetical protein